jgi:hypothetical protein
MYCFSRKDHALFIFSEFPARIVQQPGGFLAGISGFLTSFYYYPAAGSFVLSAYHHPYNIHCFQVCHWLFREGTKRSFPSSSDCFCSIYTTDYTISLLLQPWHPGTGFVLSSHHKNEKSIFNGWLLLLIFPVSYFLTGGYSWIYLISAVIWLLTFTSEFRLARITALLLICNSLSCMCPLNSSFSMRFRLS